MAKIRVVREQGCFVAYLNDVRIAKKESTGVIWRLPGVRLKIDWDAVDGVSAAPETSEDAKPSLIKGRGIRLVDRVTGRFVKAR